MEHETNWIVDDGVEVPESPLLRREKVNKYGSVPGLDDDELADPDELERQVYLEEFGPVLQLPVRRRWSGIRPDVDESGGVYWGAFGTADFERTMPMRDKTASRIAALREQRKDVLIKLEIVTGRLPKKAMYKVLEYLRMGLIDVEHIASEDMAWVVRLNARARRIEQEMARLQEARRQREYRTVEAMLARW